MKKEMVGQVPGNILGMMADLCHKLQHGKITVDELGKFLKRESLYWSDENVRADLWDYQDLYWEFFGIKKNFSKLAIPERREGFDRLIVVAEGMTPNRLFAKCQELFPAWRYTEDLDTIVSDRKADHDYAIWVRDRVEADEELKMKSANNLKAENIPGITLEERLLYELKHFKETAAHLDVQNITLCAGSRHPGGSVPSVDWRDGKLEVFWYSPDDRRGFLRSRVVVS